MIKFRDGEAASVDPSDDLFLLFLLSRILFIHLSGVHQHQFLLPRSRLFLSPSSHIKHRNLIQRHEVQINDDNKIHQRNSIKADEKPSAENLFLIRIAAGAELIFQTL
jgi:hypothetical protein